MTRVRAEEIEADAATWALRLDAVEPGQARPADLDAWLAADRRHAGALLRAQAALNLVDRAKAVYGEPAGQPTPKTLKPTRRAVIAAGGVGAMAAAAGAGAVFWGVAPKRYDTRIGEIRRVPLADGSLIAINTQSALDVALRPRLRHINLHQGEAWFEVAKDPERPFVVDAGGVHVRAVGTAFSVRRREGGADIMVTEGVVETWRAHRDEHPTRVEAGSKILVDLAGREALSAAPLEIERSLAWRNGEIVLNGQSLGEAAAEFNRYNARQIIIRDPALSGARFVGVFQINAPDSFAKAVGASIGARVVEGADAIHLEAQS